MQNFFNCQCPEYGLCAGISKWPLTLFSALLFTEEFMSVSYDLPEIYVNKQYLGTVHYLSGSPGREKYDRVLDFFHLSLTGFENFLPRNDGF